MSDPLKLPTPPPAEGATYEDFVRYKAEMRAYDRERIARGLATPEEVQRQNSVFPAISGPTSCRIIKFPEA